MRKEPIFIGGMYKSGTTLLRSMLAQHSAVSSGLETFWFDLTRGASGPEAIEAALQRLATYFDLPVERLRTHHAAASSSGAFLDALMHEVRTRDGTLRFIEKTPGNIGVIDRIWAHWPGAQVLHIIRDPRDVYASVLEAAKWQDPDVFAARWAETIGTGLTLVAQLRPNAELYRELRYEDLIRNPETTMRGISSFLELPWQPQVASFGGQSRDFDLVVSATGKASTTLERLKKPLTDERIGIWRRVLSKTQREALREAIVRTGHGSSYDAIVEQSHT